MSRVIASLEAHARGTSGRCPAVVGDTDSLSYRDLWTEVQALRRKLLLGRPRTIALALDNGPAWIVADLAAAVLRVPVAPVPGFFSREQRRHLLRDAGVDLLITDRPDEYAGWGVPVATLPVAGGRVTMFRLDATAARTLPPETAKITYTSGTTGDPKGVCLGMEAIEVVAASLARACELGPEERHLCLLPLATLLENVGGVYATLLAGGTVIAPALARFGLGVAGSFDASAVLRLLGQAQASTTILVPQMLQDLLAAVESGVAVTGSLRFVAVGGATVSPHLLERADALGLPVHEGYGLSECGSVVALNTPRARRLGSVGRPLAHARVSLAPDGEVMVAGATLSGYVGSTARPADPWPTGDLGEFDADGFLHLRGRKKNLFITSYGRNVSPEWIEGELAAEPAIAQAVVFGEGRPWCAAVIVPRGAPNAVAAAVDAANARLPEYARVGRWLIADHVFTPANGLATANGRPRRRAIWARWQFDVESLYEEQAWIPTSNYSPRPQPSAAS